MMDVVDSSTLDWWGGTPHRELGGVGFRDIFAGIEDAPNNYVFTLVRATDFHTPPHRHNFDQVRYVMEGEFGFGEGIQKAGTIGYFTEGVPYTQKAVVPSLTLLLQCEGGDRAPFLSRQAATQAVEALKSEGEFSGGFFWRGGVSGNAKQDGYEALYEKATGRKLEYPEPRFQKPLIMYPERFDYVIDDGQAGLSRKVLGVFTERELEIGFVKIEAGVSGFLESARQTTLFYAITGKGSVATANGEHKEIAADWAIRLAPAEKAKLVAKEALEFFYVRLPA